MYQRGNNKTTLRKEMVSQALVTDHSFLLILPDLFSSFAFSWCPFSLLVAWDNTCFAFRLCAAARRLLLCLQTWSRGCGGDTRRWVVTQATGVHPPRSRAGICSVVQWGAWPWKYLTKWPPACFWHLFHEGGLTHSSGTFANGSYKYNYSSVNSQITANGRKLRRWVSSWSAQVRK